MKLTLQNPVQSLIALQADDLPNFTVITGPNGSGKTHLLRAIESGHILVDGQTKNTGGQARFFDSASIVPSSGGTFTSQALRQLRAGTLSQLTNFQSRIRQEMNRSLVDWTTNARQLEPDISINNPFDMLKSEFVSSDGLTEAQSQQRKFLSDQARQFVADRSTEAHLRQDGITTGLVKFAQQRNLPVAVLTAQDLETEAIDLWGGVNVFQQNLGQLFVAYRDMLLANSLRELKKIKTSQPDLVVYTRVEFVEKYGQSPWDFVNEILTRARLPFRINAPDENSYNDYTPELTKISTGLKIPFDGLSSGEKILISFALCLYQARDGRQAIQYPEILLFDEIDAHLHPSMVKDLIATIKDVLVEEKNVKVILATHSPTTVAIAPEESVFVMRDSRSLVKTSKEAALRLLTYGVPTLSISFDARRQVFVESRLDAGLYDELYKQLRPRIISEKSLVFIAASGAEKDTGITNENGGSSVVRQLVQQLSTAGNTSVYGLIDWDTTSSPQSRIKVLAHSRRYSLDTCIVDPCLLALLIVKENLAEAKKFNLVLDAENYLLLAGADQTRMQLLVDSLAAILGYSGDKLECRYVGGESLLLFKDFLHGNGHAQAKNALDKFVFLRGVNGINNSEKGLMNRIVKNVVPESISWLPVEIHEAFTELSAE